MEFKQAVVTQNGRALMAKLLAGKSTQFTKIKVSSTVYQDAQLENLTSLTNIKQETSAQAYGNNTATVSVVGAIENTGLQTGYYINTVGLYAMDPDKGEILYSVSSASVNGYMPPDTGVSKSGFEFKIYTEVGNATKVDLTVDPAAYATHEDIERLEIHQAWMTGEDGEGFSKYKIEKNIIKIIGESSTGNFLPYTEFDGTRNPAYTSASLSVKKTDSGSLLVTRIDTNFSYLITSGAGNGWRVATDLSLSDFRDCIIGDRLMYMFDYKASSERGTQGTIWKFYIDDDYTTQRDAPLRTQYYKELGNGYTRVWGFWTVREKDIDYQLEIPNDIFGTAIGDTVELNNFYMGKKPENMLETDTPIYLISPTDDPINCYPKYIGFGIKNSDNYQDYHWILNPDWVNANAIYGTEITTLKDQLADIQTWIQAHS